MPLPSISENYDKAVKAIVEPMRLEYSESDLGPDQFHVNQNLVTRKDFSLTNKYGNTLACSFFENSVSKGPLPCVIYCHANGSCRLEALQYKQLILSSPVHYFCFDFTACGLSSGKYGSIGHFEQDDLETVISHLKQSQKVTKIALWGRSMGAVTSIMYSTKNPGDVCCIVSDSAFATFHRLVKELVKTKANVPNFLTTLALKMIKRSVKKRANFDINELKPIRHTPKLTIPALFGAPKDDTFVSPQHTKDLYMTYNGQKKLTIFEGDHNSQRPLEWVLSVINFLKEQLLEQDFEKQRQQAGFSGFSSMAKEKPNFQRIEEKYGGKEY